MAIKNEYLKGIYAGLVQRNPEQKEYLQAVEEVLTSLEPVVERRPDIVRSKVIDRIVDTFLSLRFLNFCPYHTPSVMLLQDWISLPAI